MRSKTGLWSDQARKGDSIQSFDVIIDLNLIEPDRVNDKKMDPVNIFGQLFILLSISNALI